ncbi:unnamed protein product [Prorocentrum cordatum]|uniref:Protein kinase domain-containing protein n=1 Tax=Prorocentrum cordatum TaxID=2364126 RepID=A0ABN9SNH5_9DINO|nr:unnamed protein product [Polarella glacialis]
MADIYSACVGGDVEDVKSAIRDLTQSAAVGVDINKPDIDGNTPLALAAGAGHASVCLLLIKEGACVCSRIMADDRPLRGCLREHVRLRWTPLHIAAARGHRDAARVLVKTTERPAPGQPEHFEDQNGDTPLHVAARYRREDVAQVLAASRPDWRDRSNRRGETPGDLASRVPSVLRAMHPLSAEPPLSLPERGGRAPLLEERDSEGRLIRSSSDVSRTSEERKSMEWSEEVVKIKRLTPKDELIAPGLCSYVASSCGGALGKIFLAQVQVAPARDEAASTAEPDGGQASRDTSFSTQSQGSFQHHDEGLPSVSELIHLQPVGADLQPVAWWQAQLSDAGVGAASVNQVLGASFARLSIWPPTVAELGRGTYGVVWRGRHTQTGARYAVKNIQTAGSQGRGAVARREFEVADRIRVKPHPCIVQLHHVHHFTEAALYVLVMEFCPGGDLVAQIRGAKARARDARGNYEPPPQAISWIGQVFLGLEHMHRRMETLLRDLKPDNVVLSSDGNAKLTDFGFGRFGVQSSGAWSFGIPTGSPGYVAPEVLRQETTGPAADLYSLGVLVWVLLTGGVTTNAVEPCPPVNTRKNNLDFGAHNDDFKLLAACLKYPQRYNAQALSQDPKDFVARLTERSPDRRMTHQQIRQHPLLLPLGLPSFRDGPSRVGRWLQGAPPASRASTSAAPSRGTAPPAPPAAPPPRPGADAGPPARAPRAAGPAPPEDRGSSGGSAALEPQGPGSGGPALEPRGGPEGCELPSTGH